MTNPSDPFEVPGGKNPDTIEIAFDPNVPVEYRSIVAMKTFIVEGRGGVAEPSIVNMPNNMVRFHVTQPLSGRYKVTLTDRIVDASPDHNKLDGEFPLERRWPSGNGTPGGSFVFTLNITG